LIPKSEIVKRCDETDYILMAKSITSEVLVEDDASSDPVMKSDINELFEKIESKFASKQDLIMLFDKDVPVQHS